MPECPVHNDLESSSVSGHDVRITVDEAVTDEDDRGKCLKTPSVSPNNSFIQEHQKNTDISPTLRDLEPGYVSNLAEFWTQKALRDNPGSNESVEISGELLLQEDSSTLEAEDFIKLQIGGVAELEAENTKLGQEVEEVQGGLEAKSERICQLRESLNVTNGKNSRLLREDLEKTVEELRQGMYKRTGVKSSSEGRALRYIQVNKKRQELRARTQNRGRDIEEETNDENKNVNANFGATAGERLSKQDKLAEYLRQKKEAQDNKKKKTVQPFRCGKVQHPVDSLAALPPVPGFRFSSQTSKRSTVKKIPEPRVPLRSSARQSQPQATKTNMSQCSHAS